MTKISRLAACAALVLLAVPLGGCDLFSSSAATEPPLPPVIYTVTQHSEDGQTLMVSDPATYAQYTDGGCIRYGHPDDAKNAGNRILCGGLLRVRPAGR
jgi:hypothetical protein